MDIIVGNIYQSRSYGSFTVKSVINSRSVIVEFLDTGFVTTARFDTIRSGEIKDKLSPSVHGVGFVGDGPYSTSKDGKNTEAYLSWQRMIGRCYDTNYIHPHIYKDVTVCNEWLNFQNFAKWHNDNYPNDGNKWHLDKDIKVKGNKVYSPDACMFVLAETNIAAAHVKKFKAISPTGNVVEFENMAKFCRENNLNKGNFHKVVTGKNKSCKGWTTYAE